MIIPKVWITKYALTQGMMTAVNAQLNKNMISITQGGIPRFVYFHKPYWHLTEEEARAQVRHMVTSKLKSIERQRVKMEKMLAGVDTLPETPWKQNDA